MEIVRLHAPELSEALTRKLVEVVRMIRDLDLKKPPSIAESIDWARTLLALDARHLDAATAMRTLGVVLKHASDHERAIRELRLARG
jgi:MoxR-like ATPase